MRGLGITITAGLAALAAAAPASAAASPEWIVAREHRATAASGRAVAPVEVVRATRAEAALLRRAPGVRYVERNVRFRAAQDHGPALDTQWALGTAPGVDAVGAWSRATGAGALVAVLDTGLDLGHPDLRGAVWTNPGEVPGNGVDDDRDGFVDDVHGVDLVSGDGDPTDDEGHGTHVAGIVAARAGGGGGMFGVAPAAKVLPIKVLGADRSGDAASVADGIRFALARGARIVNLSLNGDERSQAVEEAVAEAEAAGATIVASAGNDARNIDATPSYPASIPSQAVVAVGAGDANGALASFSNHGAGTLDLTAPGEVIASTARGGGHELRSGTSMAAPATAGVLALLSAARPDLHGPALRAALLGGARVDGSLAAVGGGRALSASGALTALLGAPVASASEPVAAPKLRLRAVTASRGRALLRWKLAAGATVARVVVKLDGRRVRALSPGAPARVQRRVRRGLHRWSVTALDRQGRRVAVAHGRFRAR